MVFGKDQKLFLSCYSPNSGLIDIHMLWHVPCTCRAVLCQTFIHFDVWKIPTFLGMTNTETNLPTLGRALRYTILVICLIFTKCCKWVAALKQEQFVQATCWPSICAIPTSSKNLRVTHPMVEWAFNSIQFNRPLFMQTNFQQFDTIGCLAKLF